MGLEFNFNFVRGTTHTSVRIQAVLCLIYCNTTDNNYDKSDVPDYSEESSDTRCFVLPILLYEMNILAISMYGDDY